MAKSAAQKKGVDLSAEAAPDSGRAVVVIPPVRMARLEVEIVGDTPLLMNAFGSKIQEQMKKRYSDGIKEPRGKAAPPDEELFEAAIHRTTDGKPGYPGGGMKKALLVAARALDGVDTRLVKGAIYITDDLIPIKGDLFMDVRWGRAKGRFGPGAPRRIVRAIVNNWSARIRILYDADIWKPEQIINLINRAGIYSGWGEWRPSSGSPGTFGMFHVKIAG